MVITFFDYTQISSKTLGLEGIHTSSFHTYVHETQTERGPGMRSQLLCDNNIHDPLNSAPGHMPGPRMLAHGALKNVYL